MPAIQSNYCRNFFLSKGKYENPTIDYTIKNCDENEKNQCNDDYQERVKLLPSVNVAIATKQ